jgi:hypothetical protein
MWGAKICTLFGCATIFKSFFDFFFAVNYNLLIFGVLQVQKNLHSYTVTWLFDL